MDTYRDLDATPSSDDYLLSEDIWKQFQIEEMQLQTLPIIDIVACSMLCPKNCKIEHDCMWNGHCRGGLYGRRTCNSKTATPEPPGDVRAPAVQVPAQQSLLKPTFRTSVDPNSVVPMTSAGHCYIQTPPISDDEEAKPTQTLQNLQSAIVDSYIDELEDVDLDDYFKGDDEEDFGFFNEDIEEDEEEDEEELTTRTHAERMRELACHAAESDHSYHKGTMVHGTMHSGSLGIDTPSDSEEEIDVVSLGATKTSTALPTNPSTRDRHQLQRTMQSRFPQGLKTIAPVRRGPRPCGRAPGRPRQHKRTKQNQRPYKRRYVCGHSSDSEQEPTERRHLHNNMERQRRVDLRNLFNDLKKLVPEVNKKQRAAKVLILRGAAQYCRDLTNTQDVLDRRVEFLRKQQIRYRNRLSQLRKDCAAKR